jgi:hypothetical protein
MMLLMVLVLILLGIPLLLAIGIMVVSGIGVWLSTTAVEASCGIGVWFGTAPAMMLLGVLVLILLGIPLSLAIGIMVVSGIGVWPSMTLLVFSCGIGVWCGTAPTMMLLWVLVLILLATPLWGATGVMAASMTGVLRRSAAQAT